MEKTKFRIGDKVSTKTHGVYQDTQETLSDLTGVVKNVDDEWNIHVRLDNKPMWGKVGFSYFELTLLNE